MKTGPVPKPTSMKLLQGTFRPDRATPNEPQPEVKIPPCPKKLTGDAREEWDRVTKELLAVRVLTETDGMALAGYCEAYAAWVKACDEWHAHQNTKDYKEFKNYFMGFKLASELLHKFLVEFGMTPASRTRVSALPKPEESSNPFENLG